MSIDGESAAEGNEQRGIKYAGFRQQQIYSPFLVPCGDGHCFRPAMLGVPGACVLTRDTPKEFLQRPNQRSCASQA